MNYDRDGVVHDRRSGYTIIHPRYTTDGFLCLTQTEHNRTTLLHNLTVQLLDNLKADPIGSGPGIRTHVPSNNKISLR